MFDQMSKMKDHKDWHAFCKILKLYLEGIISLT